MPLPPSPNKAKRTEDPDLLYTEVLSYAPVNSLGLYIVKVTKTASKDAGNIQELREAVTERKSIVDEIWMYGPFMRLDASGNPIPQSATSKYNEQVMILAPDQKDFEKGNQWIVQAMNKMCAYMNSTYPEAAKRRRTEGLESGRYTSDTYKQIPGKSWGVAQKQIFHEYAETDSLDTCIRREDVHKFITQAYKANKTFYMNNTSFARLCLKQPYTLEENRMFGYPITHSVTI